MKRLSAILLVCVLLLSVCALSASAQGDATFNALYSGEVSTLNYLITSTTNEFAIAANVIDTLVEYDSYGAVKPSLALSWENSADGLKWTFSLRKDASWVDGSGAFVANVTANDFVAAAKYILNAQNASSTANILYGAIAGAKAYYDGTATPKEGEAAAPAVSFDTVGVKAIDDYTLEYTLISPIPYFLSSVTYVCYMPVYEPFLLEKGASFGLATGNDTLLYCGAYYLSQFKPQEMRVMSKNALNWDAANVFIESIEQKYNKEAATIQAELYLRGEIDSASIDNDTAADWLKDEQKADMIHPVRQNGAYSYFYCLNFDPKFDAAYEPDNWKIAVNNESFRKSIAYGLDRVKSMLIIEPDNPEALLYNTIVPPMFCNVDGVDFTQLDALKAITDLGTATFSTEKALACRDNAKAELTAAGATFPVKILMQYNPSTTGWADECVVVEQQLEALLGSDYIDIIVIAGPSSGFLGAVRRSGNYAMLKCNWGADYVDPDTYCEPFMPGKTYNFPENCTQVDENGNNIYQVYADMIVKAKAIVADMPARYNAYAEAEAYLIEHALAIPYGYGTGGYTASRLNPFEGQFAPFGLTNERYKGQTLLDKPMSTDEFYDAMDAWNAVRDAQ